MPSGRRATASTGANGGAPGAFAYRYGEARRASDAGFRRDVAADAARMASRAASEAERARWQDFGRRMAGAPGDDGTAEAELAQDMWREVLREREEARKATHEAHVNRFRSAYGSAGQRPPGPAAGGVGTGGAAAGGATHGRPSSGTGARARFGGAGARPGAQSAAEVRASIERAETDWATFEQTAASGQSAGLRIRLTEIPFPAAATSLVDDSWGMETRRKQLRKLMLRWHPDKWVQRFGSVLHEEDKEAIMERVTETATRINSLRS